MKVLTYQDFKIGQIVTCVKKELGFDELEIGKKYEIVDLESRFPDAIGVRIRKDYSAFMPIRFFFDTSATRIMKINKILDDK